MINHAEEPELCKDLSLCGFKDSVNVQKPYDSSPKKTPIAAGPQQDLKLTR